MRDGTTCAVNARSEISPVQVGRDGAQLPRQKYTGTAIEDDGQRRTLLEDTVEFVERQAQQVRALAGDRRRQAAGTVEERHFAQCLSRPDTGHGDILVLQVHIDRSVSDHEQGVGCIPRLVEILARGVPLAFGNRGDRGKIFRDGISKKVDLLQDVSWIHGSFSPSVYRSRSAYRATR